MRRPLLKRMMTAITLLLFVVGVIVYWALDRYVLDHVEIASASEYEAQQRTANSSDTGTSTGSFAEPEVTYSEHTYDTPEGVATYYVAEVTFADITQLRSAFANDEFGENIIAYPSEIAASVGATFAINGDYYGFRDTGIEIRNGVVYRDAGERTGAVIYADGTMAIYDETKTSAEDLVNSGAWQTLSFGPALVDDGRVVEGIDSVEIDTNFGNHSIQGYQPRTAIGMVEANHYVFVVVDGRSSESTGVTLSQLAEIMEGLGATEAYNLDGGGSSAMISEGALVNNPLGKGKERGTSDVLWFG